MIKTAVVLAAGQSSRMYPLSKASPKPLFSVAGKSLIHWIIEGLSRAGISKVYVVVGYQKEKVEEELEYIEKEVGLSIEPVEQGERKGTAAAVSTVSFLSEPFLVTMGDAALDWRIYRELMESYSESGESTVVVKRVEDPTRFGVVEMRDGRIQRVVEKPAVAFSKLVNLGIYAFSPDVFKALEGLKPSPRGEYEVTDVLKGMRALETERFFVDVGYPWLLLEALSFYLDGQTIIEGEVEGKVVGPAYISKDSYVAEGAVVGPYAQLASSRVGPFSFVRHSLLYKSELEGYNRVEQSVSFHSRLAVHSSVEWKSDRHVAVDTGRRLITTSRKELGAVLYKASVGAFSLLKAGAVVDEAGVEEHSVVKGYVGRWG